MEEKQSKTMLIQMTEQIVQSSILSVEFNAADVCKCLGYDNVDEALKKYVNRDDARKWGIIDSLGSSQYRQEETELKNKKNPVAVCILSRD